MSAGIGLPSDLHCMMGNPVVRGRNSVVECQLPKLDVEGSNPFARSQFAPPLRRQ